jgi:hypothetical protein
MISKITQLVLSYTPLRELYSDKNVSREVENAENLGNAIMKMKNHTIEEMLTGTGLKRSQAFVFINQVNNLRAKQNYRGSLV